MNLERDLKAFVRQIRPGLIGATSNPSVNLAQLVDDLETSPPSAELKAALAERLITRDFVAALTETGLTLESGVFGEIFRRLEYKLLPKRAAGQDVLGFLRNVFDAPGDVTWLAQIDRPMFADLLSLILPEPAVLIEPLAPQLFMSLEILSLRLAGLGYDPLVTHRLATRRDLQHSFMDVTRDVHTLLEKGEPAIAALKASLARAEQAAAYVRSRRAVEGVSLDLSYRLIKIQQVVRRAELVVATIETMLGEWRSGPALQLFFEIMMAELRQFKLRAFLTSNLELLAFQITEHTGRAGEHYIARTRRQWTGMLRSAALGGAVVAGIAIVKILASKLHLPPGPEALTYGGIYAVGFLIIHALGGTLATKQPAMTASTLAASLDQGAASNEGLQNLAEVIVRTLRSQIAALVGNFSVAFPVAVLVCWPLAHFGHPLMDAHKSELTLMSLDGTKSLSFVYATIAGFCLCFSGILAGIADNWFVFNHVGERLRQSELLRKMVGPQGLERTIHSITHNLGFWVGNSSLGFMLGAMGALGQITGLPIDIRHITFASAQFGAALASVNFAVAPRELLIIGASVLGMGLVNLGVSFALTLFLVVKSRRVRFSQTSVLLSKVGSTLGRRPLELFFPLRDPP